MSTEVVFLVLLVCGLFYSGSFSYACFSQLFGSSKSLWESLFFHVIFVPYVVLFVCALYLLCMATRMDAATFSTYSFNLFLLGMFFIGYRSIYTPR